MNDQDYIRKGVDLADGWRVDERVISIVGLPSAYHLEALSAPVLAALAAQLIRQVETTDSYLIYAYSRTIQVVRITEKYNEIAEQVVKWTGGPDRTMNTIKAIVDSKVLGNR